MSPVIGSPDDPAGTQDGNPTCGPAGDFATHLRALPDDRLVALLAARPDLTTPIPPDLSVLATRAQSRLSVAWALDGLDQFTLELLDLIRLLPAPVDVGTVTDQAVAAGATAEHTRSALDRLTALAVVWGTADALRVVPAVAEVSPPYPAGLGRPVSVLAAMLPTTIAMTILASLGLPAGARPTEDLSAALSDPARLASLIAAASPEALNVLHRLAPGPPVGQVRDARVPVRAASAATPVRWLLAHGLLIATDLDTVELPREVALQIRGQNQYLTMHPDPPRPPAPTVTGYDEAGAGQATDLVRQVTALLSAVAAEPPAVLKSGGLGVRDLRRLARSSGVGEPTAALLLELAAYAGLLDDSTQTDPVWLPTTWFDDWRGQPLPERWLVLATAWRDMPRTPASAGERDDRGRPMSVLSAELARPQAPAGRHRMIAALAGWEPGAAPAPADVAGLVQWTAPRFGGRRGAALVAEALAEAATLGVTGRGALTAHGRALFEDTDPAAALAGLLPEPVDHFLVQADLTVVVPGPMQPELEEELDLVADVVSAGGATVYRMTAGTLRRGLDAGRSAAQLTTFFTHHSRTPLPQALTYMIADLSRRHGGLRAAPVASYLRSDDTALLGEIEADRRCAAARLRRIAPTVLVSPTNVGKLLEVLRAAGFAPVAEDTSGAVVHSQARARRAPARPKPALPKPALPKPALPKSALPKSIRPNASGPRASGPRANGPFGDQLTTAVALIRAGDAETTAAVSLAPITVAPGIAGVTTAGTMAVLNQAARNRAKVWLGYVDSQGGAATLLVRPMSLGAGYLRAADDRSETEHTFALHRITSAAPADDPALQ